MKVRALISFVGYDSENKKWRVQAGDELDLPLGVDWLRAGLVEIIEPKTKGKKNVSVETGNAA